MTMMLAASARALEMSAWVKAEILPIVLFFGMFFVVFGLGGIVVRHMPRKSGSMLDEILSETWDSDSKKAEQTEQEPHTETPARTAVQPVLPQTEQTTDTADENDRK